jgi:hypothetical protein
MRLIKRMVIVAVAACAMFYPVVAADEWAADEGSAYTKGSKMVSLGPNLFPFGFSAAFEYGFHKAISGSVASGLMFYPLINDWTYHTIPFLVRGAFHPFNLKVLQDKITVRDKLDVYCGLASGFRFSFWTHPSGSTLGQPNADYAAFVLGEYIGVKYWFNPKFAVFAEDCGGFGFFDVGLCMKL